MSSPALDLFQQFWSWRLRRTPEFATFVGVKDYNSVLESITEQRYHLLQLPPERQRTAEVHEQPQRQRELGVLCLRSVHLH